MTEAEWLASDDPHVMLPFIRHWASQRKLRLAACGCCRISHWFMSLHGARNGVEAAERWADGLAQWSDVCDAARPIDVFFDGDNYDFSPSAVERGLCIEDPYIALQYALPWVQQYRDTRSSNLLRCVFGSPFHYRPPANLSSQPIKPQSSLARRFAKAVLETISMIQNPEHLTKVELRNYVAPTTGHRPAPKHRLQVQAWLSSDVLTLAKYMYDTREFSAMPILADALQDAGCDSDDILNHCRGPGPHVRGCWVCDLVLGKE